MRDLLPPTAFVLLLLLGALPPLAHAGTPSVPDPAAANTIYVDTDASGAGDGTSWADAYTSLPNALQEARTNGQSDAVWVAEGTYYPDEGSSANANDRTESFRVESGIDLRGHFSGDEQHLDDRTLARGGPKTVLSGEIQQDGSPSNNAYTVLSVEGGMAGEVHIEGGAANGPGAQGRGGGAYVSGGTLHHAVLTGNRARRGAALAASGSPELEVLRVTGNHATGGGALYFSGDASSVEHLTVADNTAGDGPTGLYFIDSDATLSDVAAGPNTSSAVAERVTITFTPKTVGDDLYSGGYSGDLDYTVSTDDTTFTTTGSTTADVPITDGDDLEISTSDPEYLSTIVANNTDTEQPPFQVSGFPDEPDYQNTTVSIPKSDVVNEYQVVGFPNTSTDGRDMETTFLPHINEATRFTERQAGDETLDEVAVYIIDSGDSGWNDKAENAIADVRDVLPYPSTPPSILPDTDALVDSAEARNEFNYHYTEQGSNINNQVYDSGYIKSTFNSFSDGAAEQTRISEVYSAMADMDEVGDNQIFEYIFDDDLSFDKEEAELALRFEYRSNPNSNLQP